MRTGLTSLSQNSVLRYVEANKRIALSARCPSLQFYEKLIPLYLKSLSFSDGNISLNDSVYRFQNLWDLLYFLFRGRQLVVVHEMSVNTEIWPATFLNGKFRVRNLDFQSSNLQIWTPLLEAASIPLQKLTISVPKILNYLYSDITQNLLIKCENQSPEVSNRILRILTDQTVQSVEVENLEDLGIFLGEVLEAWITDERRIGTRVSFNSEKSWLRIAEMLGNLEHLHGGRQVHFKDERGRKRDAIEHAICFPCNETSEVVMYIVQTENSWKVHMEVIRTGLAHNGHLTTSDWILIVFIAVVLILLILVASVLIISGIIKVVLVVLNHFF